jgi:four helix bundle protein
MPGLTSHRELEVWKQGIELLRRTRAIVKHLPREERFRLADQMVRAARSVPTNISEGFGRYTKGEFRRYLDYALGSAAEMDTHLEIAVIESLCPPDEAKALQIDYGRLSWQMRRLKTSLKG